MKPYLENFVCVQLFWIVLGQRLRMPIVHNQLLQICCCQHQEHISRPKCHLVLPNGRPFEVQFRTSAAWPCAAAVNVFQPGRPCADRRCHCQTRPSRQQSGPPAARGPPPCPHLHQHLHRPLSPLLVAHGSHSNSAHRCPAQLEGDSCSNPEATGNLQSYQT